MNINIIKFIQIPLLGFFIGMQVSYGADACRVAGVKATTTPTLPGVTIRTKRYSCKGARGQYWKTRTAFYKGNKKVASFTLKRAHGVKLSDKPNPGMVPVLTSNNRISRSVSSNQRPIIGADAGAAANPSAVRSPGLFSKWVSKIKGWFHQ